MQANAVIATTSDDKKYANEMLSTVFPSIWKLMAHSAYCMQANDEIINPWPMRFLIAFRYCASMWHMPVQTVYPMISKIDGNPICIPMSPTIFAATSPTIFIIIEASSAILKELVIKKYSSSLLLA
jgi:hypothetical protein